MATGDASSRGRLDMAVRTAGHVYLFEFKVVERTPEGKALAQLEERGYADKYRHLGQPIHLVGVEFSSETRNLAAFVVEAGCGGECLGVLAREMTRQRRAEKTRYSHDLIQGNNRIPDRRCAIRDRHGYQDERPPANDGQLRVSYEQGAG